MKVQLLLLLIALALCACAVKVSLPSNHFITSETAGRGGGGRFDIRSQSGAEVSVVDNPLSATPNIDPKIHEQSEVAAGVELGVFKRLDIYYHEGQDSMAVGGMKIQLLGSPRSEAKMGGFSLAIAGGIGFGSGHEEQTEGSTIKSDTKVDFTGYEAAVLLGYRTGDSLLIYAGPYIAKTTTEVQVVRTEATTLTTNVKGEGTISGANLGFYLGSGKGAFLIVEGALTKTKWKRVEPTELKIEDFEEFFLGGSLGYAF